MMDANRKARYWHKLKDGRVQCDLCQHGCKIKEGRSGLCQVRQNEQAVLYAVNYARVASLALDPIEKKPLYHFYPGENILSIGTMGCNLACGFCQNYSLAHGTPDYAAVSPENMVAMAEEARDLGSIGIAYTYSEPLMWYEYVLDCARLAHTRGLKNVLVTNGFINEKPLIELLPYIDAMNVDLKAFTEDFYRQHCRGRLHPVTRTLELCQGQTHLEVTTLLVTGINDSPEEIGQLARWLGSLDQNIVLHLSRYHPAYRFELPPTPVETIKKAREAASQYLEYVYVGNIGGFDNHTRCAECGNTLIRRNGYSTRVLTETEGVCTCGKSLPYKAGSW